MIKKYKERVEAHCLEEHAIAEMGELYKVSVRAIMMWMKECKENGMFREKGAIQSFKKIVPVKRASIVARNIY